MVSMFWAKTIKIPKFHGHIFEIAKSGLSGLSNYLSKNWPVFFLFFFVFFSTAKAKFMLCKIVISTIKTAPVTMKNNKWDASVFWSKTIKTLDSFSPLLLLTNPTHQPATFYFYRLWHFKSLTQIGPRGYMRPLHIWPRKW